MVKYDNAGAIAKLLLKKVSLENNSSVQEKYVEQELVNSYTKGFFQGLKRQSSGKELNKETQYKLGEKTPNNFITSEESQDLQKMLSDKIDSLLVSLGYEPGTVNLASIQSVVKDVVKSFYLAGILQGVELDKEPEEDFNYFLELLKQS